ncbi:MAG: cupin domain-containing protein [Candidatus Pacebacteria bacterium]|nr:cupin domain-containing protein [Candidatus Paceibacterota bacterium]MCD8507995.1 cupin domain-containing protein [Candidatus Paceibacterota bacterium]MCD8528085.1 cupin domain-containing protein [Candidatus Paceibacterota bacterium]MCD8564041.1 cupin domain-containing protein [Candidatus Paceibacterota bacterium]
MQKGYIDNIEHLTLENTHFRKVLYTTPELQLVIMSLEPGQDIGLEIHDTITQFIRIESGLGKAIIGDREYHLGDGVSLIIPAGVSHNVINTGDIALKLYSIYTPPEHKNGIVHETKAIAEERHHNEGFDGSISE